MHDADIVHNDIKYENLVFGAEDVPFDGHRIQGVTYKSDVYLLGKNWFLHAFQLNTQNQIFF